MEGEAQGESMAWQKKYLSRYYNPQSGFIDGTTQFHSLCEKHIPRGSRILEVGAGPSNPTSEFLSRIGELHGVDIDPAVYANSALRTANKIENDRIPFRIIRSTPASPITCWSTWNIRLVIWRRSTEF